MAISDPIPTQIQLLVVGDNDSSDRKMKYFPELADSLNAKWTDKIFKWDREHMIVKSDDPDDQIAYGRCKLLANDTGVWAYNCEWTEKAEKLIQSGECDSFSILGYINPETEVLEDITNITLCSMPKDPTAQLQRGSNAMLLVARSFTHNLFKEDIMQKKKIEDVKVDEQVQVERAEDVQEIASDESSVDESTDNTSEIDELRSKIAALESLVNELSDKILQMRADEQCAASEAEQKEKEAELEPVARSKEIYNYYINRPLSEVKQVMRAFGYKKSDKKLSVEVVEQQTVTGDKVVVNESRQVQRGGGYRPPVKIIKKS